MRREYWVVPGMLICLGLAAHARAGDSRVKSKYTSEGQTTEVTISTKGSRQRFEPGGGMAIINQCDLQRTVQLIEPQKSYMVVSSGSGSSSPAANPGQPAGAGGVVTYTVNITDTGERKEMFGFAARHIRSVTVKEAGPDTCEPGKSTIETDGWYVDYDYANATCFSQNLPLQQPAQPSCKDQVRYNQTGAGKLGFPLAYTLKTTKADGSATTMQMEVAEFSTAGLDAALFEIPAGYTELKSFSDMGALLASAESGSKAASVPAQAGPKAAGTARVGVAELGNRSGAPFGSVSPRDQLVAELMKSNVDAIPLSGRSLAEVQDAAKKLECDQVLLAEVTEVKKGSGGLGKFGGFLNKASTVAGGVAGAAAGGAAPKEKVEAKVAYRLVSLDGGKQVLSASAQGSNGGGFNLMSAVNLAANVSGLGLFMKMGMFNPAMMQALGSFGGGGLGGYAGMAMPGLSKGGLDPGLSPFMSVMQATQAAMTSAGGTEEGKAVADALGETAKHISQALNRKK